MLHACNVDIGELVKKLENLSRLSSSIVDPEGSADVQPTDFNALFSALSYIHNHLDMRQPANALVSIFSDVISAWFLKSLNMTRLDAVSFISHGLKAALPKVLKKMLFKRLGTTRVRIRFPGLLSILSRRHRQAKSTP